MKKIGLTKKGLIWCIICIACGIVSLILCGIRSHIVSGLYTQQMADRWSSEGGMAQISCFFSDDSGITEDELIGFGYTVDKVLQEESIEPESENADARLWAHTYSAQGRLCVSSDKTSLDLKAIGVGGDFFLFHPLRLVAGSYFSGDSLNKDYVVIDEEIAWKLFGGNDVAGMMIYVNDIPLVISGVVERVRDKMSEAAGLDKPIIYCSLKTLETYGVSYGINHYEIVMPNPVKDYAYQRVKEELSPEEQFCSVVRNTGRFSFVESLKLIPQFGYRSMNGKAIIYPYWENVARGYEDRLALLTVFVILLALFPILTIFIYVIYRWRHKKWTLKSIYESLADKVRIFREKQYAKKNQIGNVKRKTYFDEEEKDYEER